MALIACRTAKESNLGCPGGPRFSHLNRDSCPIPWLCQTSHKVGNLFSMTKGSLARPFLILIHIFACISTPFQI